MCWFFVKMIDRNCWCSCGFFMVLFNNVLLNFFIDVIGVFSLWDIFVIKLWWICFSFFSLVILWKISIIFFYLLFKLIIGVL